MNLASSQIRVLVPYMLAYYGGVRRLLGEGLLYLRRFNRLSFQYAELCRNEKDLDEMQNAGVPVNRELGVPGCAVLSYRQGVWRTLDLLKSVLRLARLVWRIRGDIRKYDAVYVHGYRELLFVYAASLFSGVRTGPAVIWHCHGIGDGSPPPLLAFLANRCIKVIAVSKDTACRLKEIGVDSSRIDVVYNAIDVDKIQALTQEPLSPLPAKLPAQSVILLPSASIRESKGLHVAIKALEDLPLTCHLWITGDPDDPASARYKRKLDHMIATSGLEGRVHFIGHRTDIYYVMRLSDIVVVPSLCREAFGLVAAEAMALKKPVIVSNRGALPELVGSQENGWIFDPDYPEMLVGCSTAILSDRKDAERRAANGRTRIEQAFAYDSWSQHIASIFLNIDSENLSGHSQ